MMKSLLTKIVIVAMWHSTSVAQEYSFGSALTQSVAGVAALVPSSPATVLTHPALMGFSNSKSSAELSYRLLFGLSELEDFAGHARYTFGRFGAGMSILRFGQAGLYQEYTLAGASSFKISPTLSVGGTVQYTSAEFGDGQSRYAGADLAISAAFHPVTSIMIAGAVRRLTLDRIYDNIDSDPIYEASIAWTSPSEVSLGAIWTRERQGEHRFALGQIVNLTQNLDLLAGLRFDPVRYTLGGRALYRGLSLVYTFEGHPDLGSTHSFGVGWSR